MKLIQRLLLLALCVVFCRTAFAEEVIVRPVEIDDVLVNPGMGFTTFDRFEGDPLNGGIDAKEHPATSISYFRIYWNIIEPEQGKYNWKYLDEALKTAHDRGQTLMLRIAPHGYTRRPKQEEPNRPKANQRQVSADAKRDVPAWYRKMVGDNVANIKDEKWSIDPEDPRYVEHYGKMIRASRRTVRWAP